jgi:hypothetical protein
MMASSEGRVVGSGTESLNTKRNEALTCRRLPIAHRMARPVGGTSRAQPPGGYFGRTTGQGQAVFGAEGRP